MKARKPHKCTLCGRTIEKGEDYFYQRITPWDHSGNEEFFNLRAHRECEGIWQEIGGDSDWELPYPPDFLEEVEGRKVASSL